MKQILENRRDFLKRTGLLAVSLPLIIGCKNEISAKEEDILSLIKKNAVQYDGEWNGAKDAPQNITWQANLVNNSDKGERIKINGTIFQEDGKTPAPNVLIYFYHTDIDGFYGKSNEEHRHGRFRSWVLTDKKGRYEFTSIKAGQYPQRTDPAHIHFTLTSLNLQEYWTEDIWFEGDDRINAQNISKYVKSEGNFYPILKLKKDENGILNGTRNFLLKKV